MKTGKRFRKARLIPSMRTVREWRRIERKEGSYWWVFFPAGGNAPGRLIPASKHGRGRWRR